MIALGSAVGGAISGAVIAFNEQTIAFGTLPLLFVNPLTVTDPSGVHLYLCGKQPGGQLYVMVHNNNNNNNNNNK